MTFQIMHRLALALMLVPMFAHAQGDGIYKARIPFDFMAANKDFAAGRYEIKVEAGKPAILVRSADHKSAVFAMTVNVQSARIPDKAKLVFKRYGDQYVLSQLWSGGGNTGWQLYKTRRERELAVRMGEPVEAIVIASR